MVLEIGVPGSKAFRAAKALKLLQARRHGGDGPDGMGGLAPALADVTPIGRIKIAPNDVFGLGGPRIVESRGRSDGSDRSDRSRSRKPGRGRRFPDHPTEDFLLEQTKGGRLEEGRIVGSNGQLYALRDGRYHDEGPASVAEAERSGAVLNARNWGRLRGIEFERGYRSHIRAAPNREPFIGEASDGRLYTVIPDVVEEGLFHEAKSTGRFRLSRQVEAMADAANNSGGRLRLVIDKNTPLPKTVALKERLRVEFKIELYVFDPGPPPDLTPVDLTTPKK